MHGNFKYVAFMAFFMMFVHNSFAAKNILFLLADDGGFEFPFYGNDVMKTPNLAEIAAKGTIFDMAFTSVSSCCGSRSVILTGLPVHQNGMISLHHGVHHSNCFDGVKTLPNLLNDANYWTGVLGKYHVGPDYPFYRLFDFKFGLDPPDCCGASEICMGEDGGQKLYERGGPLTSVPYNMMSRNITYMKNCARKFFAEKPKDRPFFLYVGFGDSHRCGYASTGPFCEKYGSDGSIPDWKVNSYDPDTITPPYFLPNTSTVREDMSCQYTATDRMDQGIGLIMKELKSAGLENDTLIVYFSDNGIPYPAAKTNVYDPGIREPLIVYSPENPTFGLRSNAMVSSVDFVPTLLDWAGIDYPTYKLNGEEVQLTGKSLLSILDKPNPEGWTQIYASHIFHEITMYYPMRVIRTNKFKLILNVANALEYPEANDIYGSKSYQELLNNVEHKLPTHWYRDFGSYIHRDKWELYDLELDQEELKNVAGEAKYADTLIKLQADLLAWQVLTHDPWVIKYIHE